MRVGWNWETTSLPPPQAASSTDETQAAASTARRNRWKGMGDLRGKRGR
jgi:hypothetical protein